MVLTMIMRQHQYILSETGLKDTVKECLLFDTVITGQAILAVPTWT
jgi:hypothetical protein